MGAVARNIIPIHLFWDGRECSKLLQILPIFRVGEGGLLILAGFSLLELSLLKVTINPDYLELCYIYFHCICVFICGEVRVSEGVCNRALVEVRVSSQGSNATCQA